MDVYVYKFMTCPTLKCRHGLRIFFLTVGITISVKSFRGIIYLRGIFASGEWLLIELWRNLNICLRTKYINTCRLLSILVAILTLGVQNDT